MLDLIISKEEFKAGKRAADQELGKVLITVKRNLAPESSSRALQQFIGDSLDIFAETYYAVSTALEKSQHFKGEPNRDRVIWKYSLNIATRATLNQVVDAVGDELDLGRFCSSVSFDAEEMDGHSRYSTIAKSLSSLIRHMDGSGSERESISRFGSFLSELETFSYGQAISASQNNDTVAQINELKPVSTTQDVTLKRKARQHSRNRIEEKALEGDKMPDSLPKYTPSSARTEKVVGNVDVIHFLMDLAVKVLHYDIHARENFFWQEGNGFPEGVLLYGPPGAGKTYTAHAVMNAAIELAAKYNLAFSPVSLDGHNIASVYQNRSGQLLEHYFSMMRQGTERHVILMDEFDDLVPLGSNGKLSENARQRLSAFKRVSGNLNALGNYFIIAIANRIDEEDDIPREIKDRFVPLYVAGPQTPEEYGKIISHGLEYKEGLGRISDDVDWSVAGERIIEWQERLREIGDRRLCVGRGYKAITQQLAMTTEKPAVEYAAQTLGRPSSFHRSFYADEMLPITMESVLNAIDSAMKNLVETKGYNGP